MTNYQRAKRNSEQSIIRRRWHRRSSRACELIVVDDILNRVDLVLDHLGTGDQFDAVGLGEAFGFELEVDARECGSQGLEVGII